MSRRVLAVVVVVLAAGSALWLVHATAGLDAYRLFESALGAEQVTDYSGEVQIRANSHLVASYKISHQAPNRDYIEYTDPKGANRILVRAGDGAGCLDPVKGEVVRIPGSDVTAPATSADLIRSNYHVKVMSTERLAGRRAVRLRVTSRYGSAQNREYWIDTENHLVLCSRELDRHGKPIYEEKFSKVNFGSVSVDTAALDSAPKPTAYTRGSAPQPMAHKDLAAQLGFPVPKPRHLPKGYVLAGTYLTDLVNGSDKKAALYRYTDGLSSISVFVTQRDASDVITKKEGVCCVSQSGRETTAIIDRPGFRVIAVGTMPASVLSAFAFAVPPMDDKPATK